MRWGDGRRSDNVEDRRGMPGSGRMIGGGLGTVLLVLVALYFGVDPSIILNQGNLPLPNTQRIRRPHSASPEEQQLAEFVSVVLADTEDTWRAIFQRSGQEYEEPKLVLFSGAVQSACGMASAAVGPFYCPADRKVYIDLSFYNDLKNRFGAPGDFAQAYVIAHEIGHHVQNLLGIADKVQSLRARAGQAEANKLSVMMELQADCLAGRVGPPRRPDTPYPRRGRHRGGAQRRQQHRRRPAAAPGAGLRDSGFLHPRQLRAAGAVVPPRLRNRQFRSVQHLRRPELTADPAPGPIYNGPGFRLQSIDPSKNVSSFPDSASISPPITPHAEGGPSWLS